MDPGLQKVGWKVGGVIPNKGPDIRDPESYPPLSHLRVLGRFFLGVFRRTPTLGS